MRRRMSVEECLKRKMNNNLAEAASTSASQSSAQSGGNENTNTPGSDSNPIPGGSGSSASGGSDRVPTPQDGQEEPPNHRRSPLPPPSRRRRYNSHSNGNNTSSTEVKEEDDQEPPRSPASTSTAYARAESPVGGRRPNGPTPSGSHSRLPPTHLYNASNNTIRTPAALKQVASVPSPSPPNNGDHQQSHLVHNPRHSLLPQRGHHQTPTPPPSSSTDHLKLETVDGQSHQPQQQQQQQPQTPSSNQDLIYDCDEELLLKWDDHHKSFFELAEDLCHQEQFIDVTLSCGEHSFPAHKLILSVCSPYFRHLFLKNPCKHPIVVLKDVHFKYMKLLLMYMYRGEVSCPQEDLHGLLRTARCLQIRGLVELERKREAEGLSGGYPDQSPMKGPLLPHEQQHPQHQGFNDDRASTATSSVSDMPPATEVLHNRYQQQHQDHQHAQGSGSRHPSLPRHPSDLPSSSNSYHWIDDRGREHLRVAPSSSTGPDNLEDLRHQQQQQQHTKEPSTYQQQYSNSQQQQGSSSIRSENPTAAHSQPHTHHRSSPYHALSTNVTVTNHNGGGTDLTVHRRSRSPPPQHIFPPSAVGRGRRGSRTNSNPSSASNAALLAAAQAAGMPPSALDPSDPMSSMNALLAAAQATSSSSPGPTPTSLPPLTTAGLPPLSTIVLSSTTSGSPTMVPGRTLGGIPTTVGAQHPPNNGNGSLVAARAAAAAAIANGLPGTNGPSVGVPPIPTSRTNGNGTGAGEGNNGNNGDVTQAASAVANLQLYYYMQKVASAGMGNPKERKECPICGKTLYDRSTWNRHMRIHTGEKPYPCKFCGRRFRTNYNKIGHEKKCPDRHNHPALLEQEAAAAAAGTATGGGRRGSSSATSTSTSASLQQLQPPSQVPPQSIVPPGVPPQPAPPSSAAGGPEYR